MAFNDAALLICLAGLIGLLAGWLSADRDLPCPDCERRAAEDRARLAALTGREPQ